MLKTLHSKLLVLTVVMTFIPITLMALISYNSQKEALTQQVEQDLFFTAYSLATDIEVFVDERINDTYMLTNNPVLQDPNASKEEKVHEFQNFLDIHDEYFGAILLNKDGVVTVDMDDTVIGRDLSERHWFKESMKGDVFFSDIYLSSVVHNPIVALSGPIKDENDQVIGVLSPSLNLDFLYETLDRYSHNQQSQNLSGNAFLINDQGDIIAHVDREKILTENFFQSSNISNQQIKEHIQNNQLYYDKSSETMYAFAEIDKIKGFDNNWYVALSIDKKELYAPLRELYYKFIAIFIIYIVALAILIIRLSNYIVAPVKQLVVATSKFAKGEKIPHLKFDTYEELNKLSITFNMMMDKLEARERSHQKSTLILEKTNNGVLSVNKNTNRITTFNNKCEHIFGVKKENVVGMNIEELRNTNQGFNSFLNNSPLKLLLVGDNYQNQYNSFGEFECIIKNKQYIFLASTTVLIIPENSGGQNEILMVFSDVTEMRHMEERLIQSGKLEVAGQIAAGVAHEIRNPLTTIKAFFQLFSKKENCSETKTKYYDLINQELGRINDILDDFLSLAKPSLTTEKVEVDVNKVLDNILLLMDPQVILNKIKILRTYNNIPNIHIDVKRLKQVFINLIKNSIEAMPYGGVLEIRTIFDEEEQILTIEFADTGHGMDEQTLEKLGTPFFTTKENGIGLGTMTSYRIIEEMGGSLTIKSEVGMGSTFVVQIPKE